MTIKSKYAVNRRFHWDGRLGSLLDQSGNSLDLSVVNAPYWKNTSSGTTMQFMDDGGYLTKSTADFALADEVGSIVLRFTLENTGTNRYLFGSGDTGTADYYVAVLLNSTNRFGIATKDGTTTNNVRTTALAQNVEHHAIITSDGSAYKIYINGVNRTLNVAAGSNDGAWFADVTNRNNVTVGTLLRTASVPIDGGNIKEVIVYSNALTAEEASQLYCESKNEPIVSGKQTSNFSQGDLYDGSEEDNVGAWNMHFCPPGLVTDVSTGRNDFSTNGGKVGQTSHNRMFFDGASGYLKKTVADYRGSDDTGSIEGWAKTNVFGGNQFALFGSSDEATNTRLLTVYTANNNLSFQTNDGTGSIVYTGDTILPVDQWFHWRIEADGTTLNFYLNNTAETYSISGATGSEGDWFADVPLRDSITVGALKRVVALYGDLTVDGVLVRSAVPSTTEAELSYVKGAKRSTYNNDFSSVPVTLGTSTSRIDELGGFTVESGTWKISQDSTGKKWLECVTAGIVSFPWQQAYGTWEFTLNKAATTLPYFMFVADTIGGATATGQDGYHFVANASEQLIMQENTNGSQVSKLVSNAGGMSESTDTKFRITRSPAGVFTLYKDGVIVSDLSSGTNPFTDITVTSSLYFVLDFDAGDKITNLRFMLGDVTPTQVP